MPEPVLLAAYGTLMSGQRNGLDPCIRSRLCHGRPCRIAGRLYEVREPAGAAYPALVPCADDDPATVQGEVFALGADAAIVLAATDAYEECFPEQPDASTYLRQRHPVLIAGVSREAWIYVYSRPITGLRLILSGRWVGQGSALDPLKAEP